MPRAAARTGAAAVFLLALGGLLAGCAVPGPVSETAGGQPLEAEASPEAEEEEAITGSITVSAASSLNVIFPTLYKAFREEYPGARVDFNYAGSNDLATQIVNGERIDVFASASAETMARVVEADRTTTSARTFARNRLEIAVPAGNPADIGSLGELENEELTVVGCAPSQPCGALAREVFEAAGVEVRLDSQERDVTSVLNKVRLGEADAGLVYHSDVVANDAYVDGIEIPEAEEVLTDYQIAALTESQNPELADAFVEFIEEHAEEVLAEAGFIAAVPEE